MKPVLREAVLRIRIRRILMFLGLLDPDPAPDPSIIKQKYFDSYCFVTLRKTIRLAIDNL
jgi:hypothetical protein